ncbi:MAG: ABC transporter substrate-binding protein [Limnochordales bacterium]|nr:peptide ABC transporter substrate-binding protein [Bacillota bacterium]
MLESSWSWRRRQWQVRAGLGGLLLLAALFDPLLGLPAGVSLAATPNDVLVIGLSGDVDNLDPHVTMTNRSWAVTYYAYERLVRYKVENGVGSTEVEPDLATSWTVSDDGLVWTFKLRDNARFADGTPVDAHAVVYSFNRLLAIGEGPADAFPTLKSVEAVDDYTVRFTLSEPFAPFLLTLANNGAAIINPRLVEYDQGDYGRAYLAEHTMGSGPYQLQRWDKDQQIILVPNPYYGGPQPHFRMVAFLIISDPSARRLQLERGDIDIAEALPLDQIERLKGRAGIRVEEHPSLSVTYLYLNNQRSPLNDVRVRQAISHAVDYDALIQGVMLGNATQMRGPVPQGMWSHDPNAYQYTLDLNKARQLLAEAGYGNGLTLGYLYSPVYSEWEQIGLALQAQLAQIGIRLELQPYAYATMRAMLDEGNFDIAVGNWSPDFADPYMFMNYWFDSSNWGLAGNRSFYSNPVVDDLIRRAAVSTDIEERTRLYQEAQRIVIEEAAYVYLYQKGYQVAMRDNVKGYVFNPMLVDIFNIDTMYK